MGWWLKSLGWWVTTIGLVGDHPWQLSPGQKFKLEWVHRTMFKHVLETEGGTPNMFKLTRRVVGSGLVEQGLIA